MKYCFYLKINFEEFIIVLKTVIAGNWKRLRGRRCILTEKKTRLKKIKLNPNKRTMEADLLNKVTQIILCHMKTSLLPSFNTIQMVPLLVIYCLYSTFHKCMAWNSDTGTISNIFH